MKLQALLVLCGFLGMPFVGAQTILLPGAPENTERKAAEELAEHFSKMTGGSIAIGKEGEPFDGPAIYVGDTAFARKQGIDFSSFGTEEWLIRSSGKDLIVGGGKPRGTVYGVLELLEREYGVLWLDERMTRIPKRDKITWRENLNLRGKPAFEVRGLYAYFRDPHEARRRFMTRNRQNLFHDEGDVAYIRPWGVYRPFGSPRACHTFYDYTKDWGPEDEECFSLDTDGKRKRAVNGSGPGQVCLTNPRTRTLFSAKLREFIKADRANCPSGNYPWIYEISANDNDAECVCSSCMAAAEKYGAYSGVVLEFTNAIADSIAEEYPDIAVETFAYMFSQKPPKHIKARPNVLVRIAQLGSEFAQGSRDTLRALSHPNNRNSKKEIEAWSRIAPVAVWDYWILYKQDGVTSCFKAITENLKFYRSIGVKSVFIEVENPLKNIFYPMRVWLGFRCLNNPERNAEQEIGLFMDCYYGPAAPKMRALLELIEKGNAKIAERLNDVTLRRRTDMDDAFFAEADRLLDEAEQLAVTEEQRRHIAKERAVVDMVRLERRGELAPFDLDPVMKRLEKNHRIAAEDYLSGGGAVEEEMKKLHIFFTGLRADIRRPEQFKNCDIAVDLAWPQFSPHYRSRVMDVPDAAGGRAIVVSDEKDRGVLEFGFYDVTNKKQVHTVSIPKERLPQDEKFHFYPIGKITLAPKCYIWAHSSWNIQRDMDEFYEWNGISNDYEAFISIKAEGSAYVAGSEKANSVMVDRILLIRSQEGASAPSGAPLPEELGNDRIMHDITGFRLKELPAFQVKLVRDADSAGGLAMKLDTKEGDAFQAGFYDVKNKKMGYVRTVPKERIPADEKYHLYFLGTAELSEDCYVWAHPSSRIQYNLREFRLPSGDNTYRIYVSLKAQGPAYVPGSEKENAVLLDRILLVR